VRGSVVVENGSCSSLPYLVSHCDVCVYVHRDRILER
jgi:hypothetical protein